MIALLTFSLIALGAYFIGSIPFGLLIARACGIDIREHGSRNIGATNVWRVLGKPWGLLTFFCDTAKGWVAVWLGFWVFSKMPGPLSGNSDPSLAGITAAVACVLGHNLPVWLRFKGGKGVATSLGVIVGLMPLASLIVFAIWGLVVKVSRYVSLASIIAALALPLVVAGLILNGRVHGWANFYFACAAAFSVVRRHRENIGRLRAGTENRLGQPKSQP